MKKKITDIWKFITYDIWRITEDEVTRTKFSLYNIIKTIYLCINRFTKDRMANKASALTYSTLLAIVPILAILFAVARGFGFDNLMEHQFRSGFGGNIETTEAILSFVNSYLSQTKGGIFIGVGLVMLLWTVINLVSNIEITFNRIWEVKKAAFHVPEDYGLFLHVPAHADSDCGIGRSFSVCEYRAEADGRFRFTGSRHEVHDPPYPICFDLADVYRAVYLHAQHESKIQARSDCRYPGRFRLSGLPVPVYQQPVMGIEIQCYLR